MGISRGFPLMNSSKPSARGPLGTLSRALCADALSAPATANIAGMTSHPALRYNLEREGKLAMNINDKAPDFTLPDQDGEKVALKSFQGKYVVLYFYPRADTPGCTI